MITDNRGIFAEYEEAVNFKNSLGSKGLYEQNRVNERFFVGDQWYGARLSNDRPLVRHNVIKRIGEYKMSQINSSPLTVSYSADGIPNTIGIKNDIESIKNEILQNPSFKFSGKSTVNEINLIMQALSNYRTITAERIGLDLLAASALKKAYISGSGVIYTYFDSEISTGLYTDEDMQSQIKGDICSEVLDIENVHFADPYLSDIESQKYIIISAVRDVEDVRREALKFGSSRINAENIKADTADKVIVLTKLYKEYLPDGTSTVKCIKITRNAVVRESFDTRLRMYPLAIFRWEERNNLVYGESEITYLIPNQIAINRMITANVWAAMSMGMPMMVVNGDTVTGEITNDPGQIIKIYGTNEDVAGAVKYVTPPDFSLNFNESVKELIDNTLTQSGANEVALGDSRPDNASALITMRNAATMPLELLKTRFYGFIEQIAKIWCDFWITQYGDRRIKIEDENGVWYMPFSAERYKNLYLIAKVDVAADTVYGTAEALNTLTGLYEKGIINKKQYLKRIPSGIIPDISGLIMEIEEEEASDGK